MHKHLLDHLHDDQRVCGGIQLLPQVRVAEYYRTQFLAVDLT